MYWGRRKATLRREGVRLAEKGRLGHCSSRRRVLRCEHQSGERGNLVLCWCMECWWVHQQGRELRARWR